MQHQSDNPTPARRASGSRLASRRELLSPLGSEARLRAELACFTELLALLAHDLSNPLQSLTVLIELTLDDADLGPETVNKLRQALAAVEDMRGSIRTLSEFAQAGQRHGPTASFRAGVERCTRVVSRRFQRHRFALNTDIGGIGDETSPGLVFEFGVLSALLTLVACATRSRLVEFELSITTVERSIASPGTETPPPTGQLRLALRGHRGDGHWASVSIFPDDGNFFGDLGFEWVGSSSGEPDHEPGREALAILVPMSPVSQVAGEVG